MDLPLSRDFVVKDAEMRQLLGTISQRQAGGASKGGRYNKHDTARLRFIRSVALVNLARGQLPSAEDERMLYLAPMTELKGPDKIAMDAWAKVHGRDPRSKQSGSDMTTEQQTTLLEWAASAGMPFKDAAPAKRGPAPAYRSSPCCRLPFVLSSPAFLHARTHAYTHTRIHAYIGSARAHTHARVHTHTRARARARTRTHIL